MLISIHQPNFIPYLGYFEKVALSDKFVLLDNVQYCKGDWHNRNQIKTSDGKCSIVLPTSVHLGDKINEVKISNEYNSRALWNKIQLNYNRSEYFDLYKSKIKSILESNYDDLVNINIEFIKFVLNVLEIDTELITSSSLNIDTDKYKSTKLILEICNKLGAESYLSGACGANYLNLSEVDEQGVELIFQKYKHPIYKQLFMKNGFIPYLSILDLLFNEGPKSKDVLITSTINDYKVEKTYR